MNEETKNVVHSISCGYFLANLCLFLRYGLAMHTSEERRAISGIMKEGEIILQFGDG
ncbi:hypothetical protein ABKV19_000976 [Rosa sericea]